MTAKNTPHRLIDLVSYQNGSVVSKTLIERKTGTVTLFAFDKGQALSEHKAPFDALVCVLVKAGEMLVMPADVPHALKAVEPFKMMLTMIRS